METSLDLSRWQEKPLGVGYRRWVIIRHGIQQLLALRFFRWLLFAAWFSGLAIALFVFVFSQTVAAGGWLETAAAQAGAREQAVASAVGAMILLYPDICIRGVYTYLFWIQSFVGLYLSLAALTIVIPRLVGRDRACNALTVYLSRPLTTFDYLLGKLGIVAGLLVLVWTGPLIAGWFLSLVLAPGKDFLHYSLEPLGRALTFNGIALVTLSTIALGVSALFRHAMLTRLLWIGLWILVGFMALLNDSPEWMERASFTHNLGEMRQYTFQLDTILADAADKLPLLSRAASKRMSEWSTEFTGTEAYRAIVSLTCFVGLSSFIFLRRLRAE